MADETSMGGGATRFRSTLWSAIGKAQEGSAEALNRLVSEYWKPVYFYVRRRGHGVDDAKDLTQAYFAAFVEKDFLKDVSAERGRFRSFVMSSVGHFLSDARDRRTALKRGGGFNFVQAEGDLAAAGDSPERAFFKGWALAVLEQVLDEVRAEAGPDDLALLAARDVPGIEGSERKNRLHRLRSGLRERLRERLRAGVDEESEVDAEIEAIFEALG